MEQIRIYFLSEKNQEYYISKHVGKQVRRHLKANLQTKNPNFKVFFKRSAKMTPKHSEKVERNNKQQDLKGMKTFTKEMINRVKSSFFKTMINMIIL